MAKLLGTDVSRWQGTLDWAKLALTPIGGLPLTFGIAKATNGLSVDEKFLSNAQGMKANLKWWGFYHWLIPTIDPVAQGKFFAEKIMSVGLGTLPPTVDFEDDSKGQVQGQALIDKLKAFVDTVEAATGKRLIIYTGRWFWAGACRDLDAPWVACHALWHAEYPKTVGVPTTDLPLSHLPKPWSSRGIYETFWQFDGDGGLVLPGGRDADFDLFDGDEDALADFANNGPKTVCPPPASMPDFSNLKAIQAELIAEGISVGSSGADGIRGPATTAAIKQFQNLHGLTPDGIIGPMTRQALAEAWANRNALRRRHFRRGRNDLGCWGLHDRDRGRRSNLGYRGGRRGNLDGLLDWSGRRGDLDGLLLALLGLWEVLFRETFGTERARFDGV